MPGAAAERPVTTDQAAHLLGVPAAMIRVWAHRRRVVPVGIDDVHQRGSRRVPLYRLAELWPLAEQGRAQRETKG